MERRLATEVAEITEFGTPRRYLPRGSGGPCRRAGEQYRIDSRAHKAKTQEMLSQDEATPCGLLSIFYFQGAAAAAGAGDQVIVEQ